MVLGQLQRARRKVIARIRDYKAILGDATGQVYADVGFYWVRPLGQADDNGNSTPGVAYQVRSGTALVVPRGGRQVWVGIGLDGHLTVKGFVHEDLVATDVGIDPRSLQPNDPYRAWIKLKQIQNFRALPLATGNTESLKVQVRQLFYYTETGDLVRYNGTNSDTHIDLAAYVPAANLQRYVVLWLRVYNPRGLDDIQVTYSSTISSLDDVLSFDELQECADQSDADTIPIQAFRLHDAQTTLTMDDTIDVDLRQFINMPQVYGFPNYVSRHYRIHEAHSVVMPEVVTIASGGAVEIQTDGVLVILSLEDCECSGGTGGITQLTGDVTAGPGSGSQATTLATVNSSPGTTRNSRITTNGKGLVTANENGPNIKPAVRLATTAALPACTYANGSSGVGATLTGNSNGALTVDSNGVATADRILVKDQASALQNGLYTVTAAGSAGTPFVLTRDTDSDESAEITATAVYVRSGSLNFRSWYLCATDAPAVGVDPITFTALQLPQLTTKGDLPVRTSSGLTRLAAGTNGDGLIADSTATEGLSYAPLEFAQQGRLSASSTLYDMADVASSTSVYLLPLNGRFISLYNGTFWKNYDLTASGVTYGVTTTQTGTTTNASAVVTGLSDTTQLAVGMKVTGTNIAASSVINSIDSATQITLNNNATGSGTQTITFKIAASKNFDLFAFASGSTVKLKAIIWTNDTTRATAIVNTTHGIYYQTGDATYRYLGTCRTDTTDGQIIDSVLKRFVWNLYNQKLRTLRVTDSTNSWNYTSAAWRQANAAAANQVEVVVGLDAFSTMDLTSRQYAQSTTGVAYTGIGEDSTTTVVSERLGGFVVGSGAAAAIGYSHVVKNVPLGYHFYAWMEYGGTGVTFYGDNNIPDRLQSGMDGFIAA